jgi:hypothetical protein
LENILQDGCYAEEECIMIASLCYGIQIEVYKFLKGELNYFKTYPYETNNTSTQVLKIVNILPGEPNEHFDVIEIVEKEQIKTTNNEGYYFVYQKQDGLKNDAIENNNRAQQ